jgi:hypothetical protein
MKGSSYVTIEEFGGSQNGSRRTVVPGHKTANIDRILTSQTQQPVSSAQEDDPDNYR